MLITRPVCAVLLCGGGWEDRAAAAKDKDLLYKYEANGQSD